MNNQYLYINTNFDKNIWHVFMMEILEIHRLFNNNITIDHMLITNFNPSKQTDIWRIYILQYIVKNIYISDKHCNNDLLKVLPQKCLQYTPIILQSDQWYNCWYDCNYTMNYKMISYFDILKFKMNIHCTLEHVKFINRKSTRQVFDIDSNEPIEKALSNHGIHCTYFEDLSPTDQINFVKDARIIIAPHGSALTNLIFTHQDCVIIEINLRKYWFCDPICDDHKYGKCEIHEDCHNGPPFCKYDFYNICKLLNRRYFELEVDKYTDHNVLSPMHRNFMMNTNKLINDTM
jgi:hypothetical protein